MPHEWKREKPENKFIVWKCYKCRQFVNQLKKPSDDLATWDGKTCEEVMVSRIQDS